MQPLNSSSLFFQEQGCGAQVTPGLLVGEGGDEVASVAEMFATVEAWNGGQV